ncbi:MAG: hypothetical protein QXH20_03190 [Candidatus Bathyarchaeia archaeon]
MQDNGGVIEYFGYLNLSLFPNPLPAVITECVYKICQRNLVQSKYSQLIVIFYLHNPEFSETRRLQPRRRRYFNYIILFEFRRLDELTESRREFIITYCCIHRGVNHSFLFLRHAYITSNGKNNMDTSSASAPSAPNGICILDTQPFSSPTTEITESLSRFHRNLKVFKSLVELRHNGGQPGLTTGRDYHLVSRNAYLIHCTTIMFMVSYKPSVI